MSEELVHSTLALGLDNTVPVAALGSPHSRAVEEDHIERDIQDGRPGPAEQDCNHKVSHVLYLSVRALNIIAGILNTLLLNTLCLKRVRRKRPRAIALRNGLTPWITHSSSNKELGENDGDLENEEISLNANGSYDSAM